MAKLLKIICLGIAVVVTSRGFMARTQGCGCTAYDHKSPTRSASPYGSSEIAIDVVPTFGTWIARLKNWVSN